MLRIGLGLGITAGIAAYIWLWWMPEHDAAIYQKARTEIARALQEDAAAKERAAIEAENAVTPTPDDPKALADLCNGDPDCRDRKASK
jgi:hypothetical protein